MKINIGDKVRTVIDERSIEQAPRLGEFNAAVDYTVFGVQYASDGIKLTVLISPTHLISDTSWVHESFLQRIETPEEKQLTKEQAILQLVREGVFELKFKGI